MSLRELHHKLHGQGWKILAYSVALIYWGTIIIQHFFTVELKVTSGNKIRFLAASNFISTYLNIPRILLYLPRSPVRAPSNCFQVLVSCHLLKKVLRIEDACCLSLAACGLWLSSSLALEACRSRLVA